jgi:hypothetical protein
MTDMPTQTQMQRAFGVGGPGGVTATNNHDAVIEERKGRLVRGAQPASNTSFQYRTVAEFSSAFGSGALVTEWIDFGHIHFTKEPVFTSGSKRLAQVGEPALAEDASNYDPAEHFTVPGCAMVLCWKQDEGRYTGAKLLLFAQGSVPDGYRVAIYGLFTGPAVRMG